MKVKDIIKYTEWMPNPCYSAASPRFSIFMPTYRRGASGHLERAIQSVLRQTFSEFELIIIDDASTDGSFDIIKKYMQADTRVHCLHHPRNVGLPAISCYEAYKVSRGEYLMFCFDDTEYDFDVLEKVQELTQEKKIKIGFGYIEVEIENSGGRVSKEYLGRDFISQVNLHFTNFLPNLGAVIHRSVPGEIGFLDPHPAIARFTDWDYWKRASKVYELHRLNIFFGVESGLITGTSLGLTYPLNTWLTYEWSELDRNHALLPENYEEYDVESMPSNLSYPSGQALLEIVRFYETKFWFCGKKTTSNAVIVDNSEKKIFVVTAEISASVSLSFENFSQTTFYFNTFNSIDFRNLIYAQAVVICRDLFHPTANTIIKISKILKIPAFYYLDDNLVSLNTISESFREYKIDNLQKMMVDFAGVLVSTQALAEFFLQEKIHQNVYVFPPVLPNCTWFDYPAIPPKQAGTFRIGVMSGSHRYQHFREYIQPALNRLSQEYGLELVIIGDLPLQTKDITVYRFPFDFSHKLTLGRMITSEIDVLIHPASFTENNPYKTLNVLINAWAIGAVPVLPDQPPYENVERNGVGFLCDPDKTVSWYEKLKLAISDQRRAKQIRENIDLFLRREHSGRKNEEVIEKILSELPALGFATIENRYRAFISMLSEIAQNSAESDVLDNTSAFVLARIVLTRIMRKVGFLLRKILAHSKSRLRLNS